MLEGLISSQNSMLTLMFAFPTYQHAELRAKACTLTIGFYNLEAIVQLVMLNDEACVALASSYLSSFEVLRLVAPSLAGGQKRDIHPLVQRYLMDAYLDCSGRGNWAHTPLSYTYHITPAT